MSSVIDELEAFVSGLGIGMSPMPPDAGSLGDFTPNLTNVPRDAGNIIVQRRGNGIDGGDSAHRTGVAAFCNSSIDKALLHKFENGNGLMVRHPSQPPWNDPNNCSLDQLKGYAAGCWRAGQLDVVKRLLARQAARGWTCQNIEDADPGPPIRVHKKKPPVGDLIQPHEQMFLRIAAGETLAYQDPLAQFWMYAAIQVADRKKETDNNNLMIESMICGCLNRFVAAHPNYRDFIHHYWSEWRAQPQVAEALIAVVERKLKRYTSVTFPPLPENVLNLLRSVNLDHELRNIDPKHHAQLAARFAEVSMRDAANMFVGTMKMAVSTAVNQLKHLNPQVTVNEITRALADIHQPADAIRHGLSAAGIPANGIDQALKALSSPESIVKRLKPHLPKVPHLDLPKVPLPKLPGHLPKPPWKKKW